MATNIKITALTDITSANVTYNDLLAVVDMNGTPETKKGNLQLVGNLILNGAGGSYFAKAAQATNAETVSNAAQPAITSVGSLTALTVTGNVDAGNVNGTAGVFTYVSGDGANLTNLPSGSNSAAIANGTSNVNIPALNGNINTSVAGNANILIVTGTGANVTGTFNATGNAVVGNISATNLGNISTINIDGNVSNVLRGDGTFAADSDTAYGDSNVVTLLNAFGSNTITTTGLITGDGGGISNVVAANISGTINLATFAGTANAVAGANVSGEVGFAAVANSVTLANVSGAGNIASINIDGAAGNVLYGNGAFAPVSATTAQTVTTAAQPNITSTGTLTGLNVNGTITAVGITANTGVIAGDGSGLSAIAGANVTGAVTFAGTANAVAGANVTGEVTFAATANAVAYANVSGTPTLGNISTINIDGAAANVLYGNGVFAAAPGGGSYGDSNVVTLLNAFGSNTITTTGLITGDGGGLSNVSLATFAGTANAVAYANVSGTPTLGNISTINIDGSAANVLYGNGVFAAASSPALTGDGYQLANLTGANVAGEVSFAATANAVAGANVSGTVALATTSGTVSTAAQPNITSTGTLTSLTVTGALGVTTGIITGDGGGISNVVAANISGTVNTAVLAQEVINSAQPNIGSVGTLSTLLVSGNITGQSYISATTAIQTTPVVVASLPAAATAGSGARAFVSDANDTAFNAIVAGSGANNLPVFSDGTDWRIG